MRALPGQRVSVVFRHHLVYICRGEVSGSWEPFNVEQGSPEGLTKAVSSLPTKENLGCDCGSGCRVKAACRPYVLGPASQGIHSWSHLPCLKWPPQALVLALYHRSLIGISQEEDDHCLDNLTMGLWAIIDLKPRTLRDLELAPTLKSRGERNFSLGGPV